MSDGPSLVLYIEIPNFNTSGIMEFLAEILEHKPTPKEIADYLTDEVMREEVGVTLVSLAAPKCANDDFDVFARLGKIVGAEVGDE
jgi:hypothetical protein